MQTDKLARAYATLAALKEHLPDGSVPEEYVVEYHRALDHLEQLQVDVAEFRIPEDLVTHQMTSFNSLTNEAMYSDKRYVATQYMRTKLDAILKYFELTTVQPAQPVKQIGFRRPQ